MLIGFSKEVTLGKNRKGKGLVAKLGEAICSGIATNTLAVRLELDQFFNAKHKGCNVRDTARALRNDGTKAVPWVLVTKV